MTPELSGLVQAMVGKLLAAGQIPPELSALTEKIVEREMIRAVISRVHSANRGFLSAVDRFEHGRPFQQATPVSPRGGL